MKSVTGLFSVIANEDLEFKSFKANNKHIRSYYEVVIDDTLNYQTLQTVV